MRAGFRFRLSAGLSAILLVASCGGGDGGATGTPSGPVAGPAPTPAPAPSPSPSTDPPATNRLPPAPFGLQATTELYLVGYQVIPGARVNQASERVTLSWSATEKTYLLNLADLGSGKLVYTFPPSGNNNNAFSIIQPDGSVARAYVSIFPRSFNVARISWQSADGVQPFTIGQALFGPPLDGAGLPAAGTRKFVTDPNIGSALVFDFASRKVSGSVTSYHDGGGWDPEGPLEVGTIAPADIAPDGTFVAQLTVPGAHKPGELRGRLFGANAEELGLYWNAPVRDAYGTWRDWYAVRDHVACTGC